MSVTATAPAARLAPRHPWLGALLSFLFPGLGQAYAGQRWFAAVLAAPVVLLILAVVSAIAVLGDELRNELLSSRFLVGLLALDAALLAWRLFAIAHAGLGPSSVPQVPRRRGTVAFVMALLVATVATHAYVGVVVNRLDETLQDVFAGGIDVPVSAGTGRTGPINRPEFAWDGDDRINTLLVGLDSSPGRATALTDTIMVLSIDPGTDSAVLISVPRDSGYLPLPDTRIYPDGLYPRKINQLSTDAAADHELWCPDISDARACGTRSLERTIGLYLGIPIHYYATVDLLGLVHVVDAIGGVELCLPGRLVDPQYRTFDSERGIELPAGCHRYDGTDALVYARSRQGWIEMPDGTTEPQNDFARAERQQALLLGIRDELAAMDLIFEVPELLDAIGATIVTDFPRRQIGDFASLLPLITGSDVDRVVLGYPRYVDLPTEPGTNYLLIPRRAAIRSQMERLFGGEAELEGWYVGSDADSPDPAEAGGALAP